MTLQPRGKAAHGSVPYSLRIRGAGSAPSVEPPAVAETAAPKAEEPPRQKYATTRGRPRKFTDKISPKLKIDDADPGALSLEDIWAKAVSIQEGAKVSDSASEDDKSSSSGW
jgi:hypothetical protein